MTGADKMFRGHGTKERDNGQRQGVMERNGQVEFKVKDGKSGRMQ